jgi:threonine dehydratase
VTPTKSQVIDLGRAAAHQPGPAALEVNKVLLDDVVTVDDDGIIQAMKWAFEYPKIVVEPSGAIALATLATSLDGAARRVLSSSCGRE